MPPDAPAALLVLGAAVPLGAVAYIATVAALWWLAGRPEGAERDLALLARRVLLRGGERMGMRVANG